MSLRVKLEDGVMFNSGKEMAIVSNGDCGQKESVAITIDGQNVYFKVVPKGETQPVIVTVPYTRTAVSVVVVVFSINNW
jgi:hypothetical protein